MYRKRTISILILVLVLTVTSVKADFLFCEPVNLGPSINGPANDAMPKISSDGLSLYFHSDRPGGSGALDLWVSTRETISDPWGNAVNVGPNVNTAADDGAPSISSDQLELYYNSNRPGGLGMDLYVTVRASIDAPWSKPANLGFTVNSFSIEGSPSLSSDGLTLYFISDRTGMFRENIWFTQRYSFDGNWQAPEMLGFIVNSGSNEGGPYITADGQLLFFESDRPDGEGDYDIWVTRRTISPDEWSEPKNLGPVVNTSGFDGTGSVSADGSTFFFSSFRSGGQGGNDLWQVTIRPMLDFNGDNSVDTIDVSDLVAHWGTADSLYDIGPMPWGDGIVDEKDMLVLCEHIKEQGGSPLIAHWRLDESEGTIAMDTAMNRCANLKGDPIWQPDAGIDEGALQFDGLDDYVNTPFVCNPSSLKAFSAFAWVKGGQVDQVILSQDQRNDWLMVGPEGVLASAWWASRTRHQLLTNTPIINNEWYRVGITWDGFNRVLYVDDVAVASDKFPMCRPHIKGLHIGAGYICDPGSFWQGLIDDVKIYNRVIVP